MSAATNSLRDMMLQQIRWLYDADLIIYNSLPQIKTRVASTDLRKFLDLESEEKVRQRHRLEIIFSILKESTEGEQDEITRGMAMAQRHRIERCLENDLSETMMIILGRSVITHQINGYQTAVSCALGLGYSEIARLLRRALQDEKEIEKQLGLLEESHIRD